MSSELAIVYRPSNEKLRTWIRRSLMVTIPCILIVNTLLFISIHYSDKGYRILHVLFLLTIITIFQSTIVLFHITGITKGKIEISSNNITIFRERKKRIYGVDITKINIDTADGKIHVELLTGSRMILWEYDNLDAIERDLAIHKSE